MYHTLPVHKKYLLNFYYILSLPLPHIIIGLFTSVSAPYVCRSKLVQSRFTRHFLLIILRWNPSGHWVILIFSGQKSCTKIILSIFHSFFLFSRAKDVTNHLYNNTEENFSWKPRKMNFKFHRITLYTWNFSEFYLCNHNSCEIWHSFSWTSMRNFLRCY